MVRKSCIFTLGTIGARKFVPLFTKLDMKAALDVILTVPEGMTGL